MNWHRSPFVRLGSSVLSLACHTSVFGPWFVFIGAYSGIPAITRLYWPMAVVLGCAFVLSRTCGPIAQKMHERCRHAWALALGAAGILFTGAVLVLPAQRSGSALAGYWPGLFVAGMAAWLRGIRLGSVPEDSLEMQRHLVIGAATTALSLFLIGRLAQRDVVLPQALPFVLFWLIAATVSTALTRLAELAEKDQGESPELARFWPPLLVGVAFACLITALLLSAAAPVLVQLLQHPARLLFRAFEFCLMLVAYALGFAVQWGIWLVKLLLGRQEGTDLPGEIPDASEFFQNHEPRQIPPGAAEVAKWAGVVAVTLLAIVVAANYLLRIWWKEQRNSLDETRESYASLRALGAWTKTQLTGLGRSLRSAVARLSRVYGHRMPKTATQAYHLLLGVAAGKGIHRPASVTPHRFQPELKTGFPGNEQWLDHILDAFACEYYGEQLLSHEEMDAVSRALAHLRGQD